MERSANRPTSAHRSGHASPEIAKVPSSSAPEFNTDARSREIVPSQHRARGHVYSSILLKDDVRAHLGDHYGHVYVSGDYYASHPLLRELNPKAAALVKWLQWPRQNARKQQIQAPHQGTFEWIFEEPSFLQWARSDSGVYWIEGKAGSGKSTLMKMLSDHSRTRSLLRETSRREVVVSSFFFWKPGAAAERSKVELIRSLLCSILEQKPALADVLFPDWNARFGLEEIELEEAMQAFHRLSNVSGTSFCFFIDGLDECEDDEGIVELIVETEVAKLCVSSRPWRLFHHSFAHCPSVVLQDHTCNDITTMVKNHLAASKVSQTDVARLATAVAFRSTGVFLWAVLAAQTVLEWAEPIQSGDELENRLDELPSDLLHLLETILAQIPKRLRPSSFRLFRVANRWLQFREEAPECCTSVRPALNSLVLALAVDVERVTSDYQKEEVPLDYAARYCQRLTALLGMLSQGLLQETDDGFVDFLHTAIAEYLRHTVHPCSKQWLTDGKQYDVDVAIMMALAMQLRLDDDSDDAAVDAILCDFMDFVCLAEMSTEVSYTEILDKVEQSLTERGFWSPASAEAPLASLAVEAGCKLYLEAKLNQPGLRIVKQNPDLLVKAMTTPRRWESFEIRPRMVELLLQNGADPVIKHEVYGDDFEQSLISSEPFLLGAWEIAVLLVTGCRFLGDTTFLDFDLIDHEDGLEILELLLDYDVDVKGSTVCSAEMRPDGELVRSTRTISEVLRDCGGTLAGFQPTAVEILEKLAARE